MRTREMRSVVKLTPKNESVSLLAAPAGATPGRTKKLPRDALLTSKYCIDVVLAKSTSVKTAPKPLTVAGVAVPAPKKLTSGIGVPHAPNKRRGPNVRKMVREVAVRVANS